MMLFFSSMMSITVSSVRENSYLGNQRLRHDLSEFGHAPQDDMTTRMRFKTTPEDVLLLQYYEKSKC